MAWCNTDLHNRVSHVDWHEFYIVLALLDSYPSNQVARCPDWTVIRKC